MKKINRNASTRRNSLVALAVTLGLLVCALTGCQSAPNGKQTSSQEQDRTTLKIGVVLPYEGRFAGYGEEGKQGIELAAKHVSGIKVSVKYADSKGEASDAVRGIRKLIDQDKVDAVIGEVLSANTFAIAPVAQELKRPLIAPASTAAGITEAGDFVMRVCFLDPEQGSAMAAYAKNKLGITKVAMLFEKGNDYSVGLAEAFRRSFTTLGGTIVGEAYIRASDPDMRAHLIKVRDSKPEALFIPTEYPTAGQLVKQARELGMTMQILGSDAWNSPELFKIGGAAMDGCLLTAHFAPDSPDPVVRRFVDGFKETYGVLPANMAALSYDAAGIIIDAARRATSSSPEALKDALLATKDFSGATGRITMMPNGNVSKDIMIVKLEAGAFKFVETVRVAN